MSHAAAVSIPREDVTLPAGHAWTKLPAIGGGLALVGGIASAVLGSQAPQQFFFSWLVAFAYFLSIALGCLYFVLIHQATQAGWGVVVRRLAENAAATLPAFVLLFLPIAGGISQLYPWSRPELVAHDHLLQWKQPYLNTGFFLVRGFVVLTVWSVLALWAHHMSRCQDGGQDLRAAARFRRFSGPAMIPLALTHTISSVDWLMSLDPHWYSTMFGVYAFSGSLVACYAFLSLLPVALQRSGLMREVVTTEHFHDLGKLLFAFTVFWAYIAFSQFFLIWYANIPEETIWFRHRMHGSWAAVSALLAAGHFVLPFFFLMPRSMKRNPKTLAAAAIWILAMHAVDLHWLVMPSLHADGLDLRLLDITTFATVGGVFLAAFGWHLGRGPLLPTGDPRLPESLGFENI